MSIEDLSLPLDDKPKISEPKPESVSSHDDRFVPIYTNEQNKAVNEFYKLKSQYEETLRRKKDKIIKNPALSKEDKRSQWRMEKIPCVNCKKPVGTFFSVKGRKLSAHCGAVENPKDGINPCNLRIDIDLAAVTTMQSTINEFDNYKESDKENIIITKLNLLFGFLSETQAIEEFEKKKKEFEEDLKTYNEYLELFYEVHSNKKKMETIKLLNEQAKGTISEIKDLIKTGVIASDENTVSLSVARDAVTIKLDRLDKILLDLRTLKYEYYAVENNEENPNEHILIAEPITIMRSEVVIDKEPKINSFEMK